MSNNKFIPWEQLFEETIGVYGLVNEGRIYDNINIGALKAQVFSFLNKNLELQLRYGKISMDKMLGANYDFILFTVKTKKNTQNDKSPAYVMTKYLESWSKELEFGLYDIAYDPDHDAIFVGLIKKSAKETIKDLIKKY